MQLTQTTASGADPQFDAVTVTVTCTLTAVANPGNPPTQQYYIYDATKTIDLSTLTSSITGYSSNGYLQTPNCRMSVTEAKVWTIPSAGQASIKEVTGNKMQLTVQTNTNTNAGTFTVKLVNSITLSTQAGFAVAPEIEFTIEVLDPCATTTFNNVAVNPITMILGATHTQQFTEATTATEQANAGLWLCGNRVYVVVDSSDAAVSWIAVTGSNPTYTITAKPILESLIGSTHNYKLKITFADSRYPTPVKKMALDTTITAATCNCNELTWDTPTAITGSVAVALGPTTFNIPTITMNAASKLPTPEIRKCFASGGGDCANSMTYAAQVVSLSALPPFVV
jgi:hypothetical protein